MKKIFSYALSGTLLLFMFLSAGLILRAAYSYPSNMWYAQKAWNILYGNPVEYLREERSMKAGK